MDPILGPRNLLKTGFATIPCTCLDPSEKRFEARQGLAETTPRTPNVLAKGQMREPSTQSMISRTNTCNTARFKPPFVCDDNKARCQFMQLYCDLSLVWLLFASHSQGWNRQSKLDSWSQQFLIRHLNTSLNGPFRQVMASHLPNLNHPFDEQTHKFKTAASDMLPPCDWLAADTRLRCSINASFRPRLPPSSFQLLIISSWLESQDELPVQMYLKGEVNWCRGSVFDRKPAKGDNSSYDSSIFQLQLLLKSASTWNERLNEFSTMKGSKRDQNWTSRGDHF